MPLVQRWAVRNKFIPYNPHLKARARRSRRAGNLAEALLWLQLKGRQMKGYDFHRQKPLGKYIVDFNCPKLLLAIEIDGVTHSGVEAESADRERQNALESLGVHVMRFLESDVRQNMNGVITAIGEWIERNR